MSHVSTHDMIECVMCSFLMNSLSVISDECVLSQVSHVDESCHNTRHDREYTVLIYDDRVIYSSYMSSHVSHKNESWHNAGHDRVYNVLVYDECIFSHLWWKCIESRFTCGWVMSQHTTQSSVQCAHFWWTYIEPCMMNASWVVPRVPGLPIRICARGCNNRSHTRPQMSAIDVTGKTFFVHLYLVLGLRKIAPWVNCPYASATPTIHCTTISRFLCNFPPNFFGQHDSASSLAESRYPRRASHVDESCLNTWYILVYGVASVSRVD